MHDTLPVKLGDGTEGYASGFMLGTDKWASIMMNWSWFHNHTNIQEGVICAFHFKRKARCHVSHCASSLGAPPSTTAMAYTYDPCIDSASLWEVARLLEDVRL